MTIRLYRLYLTCLHLITRLVFAVVVVFTLQAVITDNLAFWELLILNVPEVKSLHYLSEIHAIVELILMLQYDYRPHGADDTSHIKSISPFVLNPPIFSSA